MNAPANFDAGAGERPSFRQFVAMMASIMALIALAIDSMLPALPAISQSLNVVQDNDRQLVIGAFMLGFGGAQLFVGTLSDRFGRRPVLLTMLVLYTIFSIAGALAPNFGLLVVARVAQGASAAGGRVLVTSIIRDRYVGRQMARVMSLAFIVFMAAPIIAPAIGQVILLIAPWRWIFVMLGLAGAGIACWIGASLPETLKPQNRISLEPARIAGSMATVLRDRQSTGYATAVGFMTGSMMSFLNSISQVLEVVFGSLHLMVPVFACTAAAMAIGSLVNSRLVVRLGMRLLGHWALIAFTCIAGLHLIVTAMELETLLSFTLLQAVMMGCFGLAASNFSALAMEHVGKVAGTASSLQGAYATIMGASIGIATGRAFDGTTVPLYTGIFLCGLGALAAILVTERGKLFHRPVDR
jgi:DHA1 family bicyclomycin/chloramphenicol resistance-like MFS transporter